MDRFGMKLLAQPIAQCHSLTRLNLNGNRIGLDGAAALARAIIQVRFRVCPFLNVVPNYQGPTPVPNTKCLHTQTLGPTPSTSPSPRTESQALNPDTLNPNTLNPDTLSTGPSSHSARTADCK